MTFSKKTTVFLFAAFCLINVLGAHFLKDALDFPIDTKVFYSPAAENILAGNGYTLNGVFADRYPPGYPVFLTGVYAATGQTGENNFFYPYVIALMQAISCVFLYKTAKILTGSASAAVTAALFFTYPFFAVLSMTHYAWTAMPLFTFIFYASLYLFFKNSLKKPFRGGFFLSGFLLGLSALVWPASVYLAVPLGAYLLLSGAKERKSFLTFIPGAFLPILIWSAVVSANTGSFRVSSGQWPSVKDGLAHSSGKQMAQFSFGREAVEEIEAGNIKNMSGIAVFARQKLESDFKDTAAYLMFKLFRPWYATDSERFEKIILAAQAPYLALSILGFIQLLKEKKKEGWLLLAIVVYFWLAAFSVLSILRYMIPAMGLLMVFVPLGGEAVWKRIVRK